MSGTARNGPGPGTPWTEELGSARAAAAGDLVLVAGTTALDTGGAPLGGSDPYEQARAALGQALEALGEFGLDAGAVVRTRMYLTHVRDVGDVARAHRELFAAVRPAATLLVVAGFADPRALVQVELEAHRPLSDQQQHS